MQIHRSLELNQLPLASLRGPSQYHKANYEGRLQSSLTNLNITRRNFVEVRWRSHFRSTSLGKRGTSYNAPPNSRKWSYGRFEINLSTMAEQPYRSVGVARLKSGNGRAHRDRYNPINTSAIQSGCHPMRFLGFSKYEKGAPTSKPPVPLSSWSLRQTVCSTFSRSGWCVVRSASLAKGGT
jgi:hypothetical protein